ncbi:hypothetical protein MRB53_042322 [Persea americana]|nr:hypothetical protein MRB53_042322 [Persea americana]
MLEVLTLPISPRPPTWILPRWHHRYQPLFRPQSLTRPLFDPLPQDFLRTLDDTNTSSICNELYRDLRTSTQGRARAEPLRAILYAPTKNSAIFSCRLIGTAASWWLHPSISDLPKAGIDGDQEVGWWLLQCPSTTIISVWNPIIFYRFAGISKQASSVTHATCLQLPDPPALSEYEQFLRTKTAEDQRRGL